MKVLVLGKRGGILRWYEHVTSVTVPGHDIRGFAFNYNNEWEHLSNKLGQVFLRRGLWETVARRLVAYLAKNPPDACIIVDRYYLTAGIDDALAALGVPVCQWVGDRFEPQLIANRCVSHFFFTDSMLLAEAESLGCTRGHYLPLAVDPALFRDTLPWAGRSPEPLFVGAWSENREALLARVRVPLAIYGKGWGRLQDTPHRIHAENIPLAEVAALYGRHRFVLNVINSANIVAGLNMRCFEAPAAGACLVTDRVADLARCYTAGEEVLAYEGAEELDRLLLAAQADDAFAQQVAARGRARCLGEHTYACRVQAMLDVAAG